MTGQVVSFNAQTGYGFIRPSGGGRDVFLHARALRKTEQVRAGDRVEFEVWTRAGRFEATDVRLIGDPAAKARASEPT